MTSRTIAITGSASGIGAATAAAFEADGHRVIGIDLRNADVEVDLGTREGRAALVDGVTAACAGTLDAVVACAGVTSAQAVAVNHFGMVATLVGLRPLLLGSAAPRAVAVASSACIHEVDDGVVEACLAGDEATAITRSQDAPNAYASSKQAMARWVRSHAATADWAGAGIPLNAVSPGTTVTPMTQPFLDDPNVAAHIDTLVPMPLHGHARPEVVAALLVWLASEANTHVTGQNIFVDGGSDVVLRGDAVW